MFSKRKALKSPVFAGPFSSPKKQPKMLHLEKKYIFEMIMSPSSHYPGFHLPVLTLPMEMDSACGHPHHSGPTTVGVPTHLQAQCGQRDPTAGVTHSISQAVYQSGRLLGVFRGVEVVVGCGNECCCPVGPCWGALINRGMVYHGSCGVCHFSPSPQGNGFWL